MQDSDEIYQQQPGSALVVWELARLDIDVAPLSEVHFPEQRSLMERGAQIVKYTL